MDRLLVARPRRQDRLIITGLPRSGTGFIQSIISSLPRAFCKGEVFAPELHIYDDYVKMATTLSDRRNHEIFGIKFLFFQSPNYWADIEELSKRGWKVIGTRRKDSNQQALSYYLATATGYFHRFDKTQMPEAITIDLALLDQCIKIFTKCSSILNDNYMSLKNEMLVIDFEEDIVKSDKAVKKVTTCLGHSLQYVSRLEQPTFEDKLSHVTNHNEVTQLLDNFNSHG